MIPDYYTERIRNPTYAILINGIEKKRLPFLKQATIYAQKHSNTLWGDSIEIVDIRTGEQIYKS